MKTCCIYYRSPNSFITNKNCVLSILILTITFKCSLQTTSDNLTLTFDNNVNSSFAVGNSSTTVEQKSDADHTNLTLETRAKEYSGDRNNVTVTTTEEYRENTDNVTVKVRLRTACDNPIIQDQKDYLMGTIELLERAGYKTETHYVTTKDGYIFQIHRIPAEGKPVVYALHGFVLSSRDLLMNCDGRALAHKLANDGYDVWLGNFRGNTYGRNHTHLSPKSREFWSFSVDEIFAYDSPAAIDYILNVTGQEKLNWLGFSFGGAALFGMLSSYPEYNEKINLGITIAPAALLGRSKSPALRFFSKFRRQVEKFFLAIWNGEAFARNLFLLYHVVGPSWCKTATLKNRPGICPATLWYLDSRDPKQLNHPYLPLLAGGMPSPTSARVVGQGLQWIARGKFEKYQFQSDKENLDKYGSINPPEYNISKTKIPILVFRGDNDYFVDQSDILEVVKRLPNVIESVRVNSTKWNHFDFMYGKDADLLVYDHLLTVLRKWNFVS